MGPDKNLQAVIKLRKPVKPTQIVCKYIKMNNLHLKSGQTQSGSVKLDQTDVEPYRFRPKNINSRSGLEAAVTVSHGDIAGWTPRSLRLLPPKISSQLKVIKAKK